MPTLNTPGTRANKSEATEQIIQITLPPLKIATIDILLVGDSPLICHKWDDKAIQMIVDKQAKKAKGAREVRDPDGEYQASMYHLDGGRYGFPSTGFKTAAVDACSHIAGVTKVQARGAFHVVGEFCEIEGEPTMRRDMVRVGMGAADVRYRGEFREWRSLIRVRHNVNVLSASQIVNLFNTAGFAIGVGEWRPQRDGSYGMFHVATEDE